MAALMAHRGPDGEGLWSAADGRVVFGHRRLAIIDPSPASAQPMVSPDGDLALTYNGEIYNYLELRAELERAGVRFSTQGDVEVLLAAWRTWGAGCVTRFNGMFAFALWDRRQGILFCARDRFGEKPFLYTRGNGFFAFASEYKALLALEGVSADIAPARVARFLRAAGGGLDQGGETAFPAIHQLPPAHRLILSASGDVRVDRYWDGEPDPGAGRLDIAEAARRFRDLLDDSVALRLRSDVPVGSCLSGGLDSGSIACLVRRRLGGGAAYHVFSGRFPDTPADEGAYMDAIAAAVRPIRHETVPDPAKLIGEIGAFAWANELPVDSASQYAQYCVFRLARENGVKVLLDGQGADEVLGGYEQYFAFYLAEAGRDDEAAIRARYPGVLENLEAWHLRLPHSVRRILARISGRGSDIAFGLNPDLVSADSAERPKSLRAALRKDSLGGFLTTLLRYGDRNSMAHSVEVRLPFTDHRLFEMAQGLSARVLMGDAQTKRILREAMAGVLPEPVRTRWRKQGFLPPHAAWMRRGLLAAVETVIEDPSFVRSPLWEPGWWRSAVTRFRNGEEGLASALWKVLATESWRTHFVARAAAQAKHAPLA
ncbi:MAG: asparagine synthase (glutamine-hydrolyzing) [Alphaproteobacteria bacterium]|nr:asparagine synthase (glutamine-hydrolyzing) [Alphaproteobacteria bacterium]